MNKFIHKIAVLLKKDNPVFVEGQMVTIEFTMPDLLEFGTNVVALKSVIGKHFNQSQGNVHLIEGLTSGHVRVGKDFINFEVYIEDIERGADQWLGDIEKGVANLSPGILNLLITKID